MGEYVGGAIAYLRSDPLVAVSLGLVLLYLIVRRTKAFLFLLLLAAVLGMVLYLIADIAGTGGAVKRRIIDQTAAEDVK
jgi:hypothetical protein